MNIKFLIIIGITISFVIGSIFLVNYQIILVPINLKINNSEPQFGNPSNQKCAELFDKIFDTWKEHVEENYGRPGQPTLEPPTVAGLIAGWKGGEEFRNTDCRYRVNDWAYLVEYRDQVWGYVDWPKLESFEYIPPKYLDAYTYLDIIFGEPREDKLLPITIREYTRKANHFDQIISWNFAFVKNTEDTQRYEYWDFLPQEEQIRYNVVGGDFVSIRDESMPYVGVIDAIAYESEIDCGSLGLQTIETAPPNTIPIQKGNYHVIVEYREFGIYPDKDGIYSFEMAAFFDIRNSSLDKVTMISDEKEYCNWTGDIHPYLDPEYPIELTFVDWKFKLK